MPAEQTKELCILVKEHLKEVKTQLNEFLDYNAVPQLTSEFAPATKEQEAYVREFLHDLRYLSVACERGYELVIRVLRRADFHQELAEKALRNIAHTCVHFFYHPQNEVYWENSRYSYTRGDSIIFRQTPPTMLRRVTLSLSGLFTTLRDELDCYETDDVTRMRL